MNVLIHYFLFCWNNTSKTAEALKAVLKNAPINAKGFDVKVWWLYGFFLNYIE